MQNSDKSPTTSPENDRSDQKRAALRHFRSGGTPADFAKDHGIPRTTVIGWLRKWDVDRELTVMGRPRDLPRFNESEVLKLLLSNPGFHGWSFVQNCIRKQPLDNKKKEISRRSIFRLMKRWGLSPLVRPSGAELFLVGGQWIQPPATIDKNDNRSGNGLRATIWRMLSGRGMEGFMFTTDESVTALETVAREVAKVLKRRRRQVLCTNHNRLVEMLEKELNAPKKPQWQIHSTSD